MTAANREASIKVTLAYEGGYSNDPGDPGGATKFGITRADVRRFLNPVATDADVKALTLDAAVNIYRQKYWAAMACDDLYAGMDLTCFDLGVNSGIGRMQQFLAAHLGVARNTAYTRLAAIASGVSDKPAAIKAINARRLSFLEALKTWKLFGKGWGRRVAGIEATSVKMYLAASGLGAAAQTAALQKEAEAASAQSKQAAAKATGSGAGASATATHAATAPAAPPAPAPLPKGPSLHEAAAQVDWLLFGEIAAIVLLAAAVVYFVWAMHVHAERADAYVTATPAPAGA